MHRRGPLTAASLVVLAWPGTSAAFRTCPVEYTDAYRVESHYLVGELDYDAAARAAGGSETHYNFSNQHPAGVAECHVTYELSGIFAPESGLFLLEATRSSVSHTCEPEFVAAEYPRYRNYTLAVVFSGEGRARLYRAESGELLAEGDWPQEGLLSYKTPERCAHQ